MAIVVAGEDGRRRLVLQGLSSDAGTAQLQTPWSLEFLQRRYCCFSPFDRVATSLPPSVASMALRICRSDRYASGASHLVHRTFSKKTTWWHREHEKIFMAFLG